MSDTWDVAVVGAGPAGAVTALAAARRGLSVVLLDRATFPRRKVCGCCLNTHALSALAAVGLGGLPARLGAVPLGAVLLAAKGRTAAVLLAGSVSLSREAFDGALLDVATRAGVTFRSGATVKVVGREANLWNLTAGDAPLRARVLVDASGLNGRLTDPTPVVAPGARIGAGAVFAEAPARYARGTIFMAAGRGGYVGLVRLEDGRLDAAAAFDAGHVRRSGSLAGAAAAVLREAGLPQLPPGDWKGTPPLTRHARAIAGPGWFAVGDAAGYVEPFTGEGMAWGVAGAATLAPLLRETLDGADRAAEWRRLYRRHVGQRQTACRLIAALLRRPAACGVAVRVLRGWPGLAGPVVRQLGRPLPPPRGR